VKRCVIVGIIGVSVLSLAVPVNAATALAFTDNFGQTTSDAPGYGLNDNLAFREAGDGAGPTGLVTYTRSSGLWNSVTPPPATDSVVANGALTFTNGPSAVRLDAPATMSGGTVTVTATLTPTVTPPTTGPDHDWSSLVLTNSSASAGYVSNSDVTAAMLVTPTGGVQLWQAGKEVGSGQVAAARTDTVSMAVSGSSLSVTVDGTAITAALPVAVPARNWLYLGRYADNNALRSAVTGLTVSSIDNSALRQPAGSNLKYFGYYPTRETAATGDHVKEVAGRSNLDWILISDPDDIDTQTLSNCAPHSCVVYAAYEFFASCQPGNCPLNSDADTKWKALAAAIKPYIDNVAAFYLLDEAYWVGASEADIETSAHDIKTSYPDIPIILSFAAPTVTHPFGIPADVDWVAFDQYCQPVSTVTANLHALEAGAPGKPVLLFVQSSPLSECAAGANTDAAIAAAQQNYLHLAQSDPRVTGLFEFGLWATKDVYPTEQTPVDVPLTTDGQERIAARLGV
jgi:hypothetical protein